MSCLEPGPLLAKTIMPGTRSRLDQASSTELRVGSDGVLVDTVVGHSGQSSLTAALFHWALGLL